VIEQQPEDQSIISQLRLENKLIASAWAALNSRIQKDNVIIARRREEPKSWLGRQRVSIGLRGGFAGEFGMR